MLLIQDPKAIRSSEITDPEVYRQRRRFMQQAAISAAAMALPNVALTAVTPWDKIGKSAYSTDETLTPKHDVTHHNNFYEFGTDKALPAKLAQGLKTRPWTLSIAGEVAKPAQYEIDDLIRTHSLEERIYRLRCVEAWSMVIPWVGIPLAHVIKRLQPTSRAKYVRFVTLHDPEQMPGQRPGLLGAGLDWPYVEGLRMDEAMHPLTLLAVGLYGEILPNQNGAPVRLVVPWKYGFKSIKSIVRIEFSEQQPDTTWNLMAPNEYGFYANVNPQVDHPRWSQKRERRLGGSQLFVPKRDTLMFNGYAEQVASLYSGMNLKRWY